MEPNPMGTLAQTILLKFVRTLLVSAGTWLVAKGVLQDSQQSAFVEIAVGVVTWLGTFGWAAYQAQVSHKAVADAAAGKIDPTKAKTLLGGTKALTTMLMLALGVGLVAPMLSGCATTTTAVSHRDFGKALTLAYDAGDLAVQVADHAALTGDNASKAKSALAVLRKALADADAVYAAGNDPTAQLLSVVQIVNEIAALVPQNKAGLMLAAQNIKGAL